MIDFTFQEVRSGQQWGVTARDEMTANKELAYSLGMVPNEFFLVSSRVLSSITF